MVERPQGFPGTAPLVVLEPGDARATAAMLRWADAEGVAVVPAGGGTKLTWGAAPTRAEVVLSTARLAGPIDHCAGDLTGTLPAGASLEAVNAALGRAGQWLPLDPPFADRATIGGIVAAHDSGPRRLRYGAPRDLIIGIEMASVDGRVSKAGGRVVKNVAGYDLPRLMCGSFGTLAVITSATFKLAPLPPASRTVVASARSIASAAELAQAISCAPLTPSALEIEVPECRLLIRFETTAASADRQAAAAHAVCRGCSSADVLADQPEAEAWRRNADRLWRGEGAVLKISVLPTRVPALLARLDAALSAAGVACTVGGRIALGVLYCRLQGDEDAIAGAVTALRAEIPRGCGSVVVISSPASLKERVGAWGDAGNAVRLMQAVKAQFDPRGILSPGREPRAL
jgi:glycolate oxidase FAD binding subunit